MKIDTKAEAWDPESTAGFWINRASRLLLRRLDGRLRPFGFAMSYLPVLRALARNQSLSQKELAQLARVEQPTMAEMLARMERDGVVQREPNPDDKRGNLISLTRSTRARFPKAKAALVEGEREAMAGLSDAEKVLLRKLLQRVVRNVESSESERPSRKSDSRPIPTSGVGDKARTKPSGA
jgi:MarR family transcriptional regulator, transcriptional regulator for hemolysin